MTNLTVLQDGSEQIHYSNPAIPIYVCRGNLRDLSGMAALCHWHEDVELLLPYRGYLSYNVNGSQLEIAEGDAIFINTRNMHYGYSADGTDCEYICVAFRPQLLCGNEALQNQYVLPVLTSSGFTHAMLDHTKPEHQPLLSAVRRLDSLYDEKLPGFEMNAMAVLFELWQALYALTECQTGNASLVDTNMLILKRMLEFIRTHYPERITLDQIAASGGVCRSRCCQIFRKHLSRTPNDYLNSFRLEKGTELLKSTSMTVTEIADCCGFSSSSYFTEMFTRKKGCPPTAYRKSE